MDKFHEECGVVGVYGHDEAATLAYLSLYALQHRGQESAGIVASNGDALIAHRGMGLVADIFGHDILSRLEGRLAIGHNRYSTSGSTVLKNCQPFVVEWAQGALAIAHNGNLVNAEELREKLERRGSIFQSTSDTEVIIHLIAASNGSTLLERIVDALAQVRGAYSLAFMTEDQIIAARDPSGFRPLALGRIGDGWVVASETCAFDLIEARYEREIQPGEIVMIGKRGVESVRPVPPAPRHNCVFEYIYFARPDSRMAGTVLQVARARMGENLWHEAPVEADVVIPVPDSGNAAARGLARAAGLPQDDGFIKNRYVARTFIQPGQELRRHGLRLKFNPLPEVVAGKRLIVVDDSIVRGNTTRQIVQMLREAGAAEIHLRISAPPIKHPCHYGIDMSTREEMIAHGQTVEEIAAELGVESLHYLSLDGVYNAVGVTRDTHCDACFTGEYPLAGTEEAGGKYALESELPLIRA
jgi:amidophosphoribosyltransferase